MQDPDSDLFPFLISGVPLGINEDILPSKCFPLNPTDTPYDPPLLSVHHTNWQSAEDDPTTVQELINKEVDAGWVEPFHGTLEEAQIHFGHGLALGKLGLALSYSRPPRLVLDSTVCGVNLQSKIPEKAALPTARDVVRSYPLRASNRKLSGVSFDVKSAHKQMAVHPSYRGYLCVKSVFIKYVPSVLLSVPISGRDLEELFNALAREMQKSSSMPRGNSSALERPCCWCLFAHVLYFCSVPYLFFEKCNLDLCGLIWCVTSISRNKRMHALHGNGPESRATKGKTKGKENPKIPPQPGSLLSVASSSSQPSFVSGKGKGSEVVATDSVNTNVQPSVVETDPKAEAERIFREQMLAVLPSHLSANTPQLVAEEWNTKVVLAHELSAHGGVALVHKKDLPSVVARVGQTTRPTAVVTSQPALLRSSTLQRNLLFAFSSVRVWFNESLREEVISFNWE